MRLIGNQPAQDALAAASRSGTLHHAWLIAGPEGLGKASFARIAAARLLAEAAGEGGLATGWDVPSASQTLHLIAAATHPDYLELAPLPKSMDLDKVQPGVLARAVSLNREQALNRLYGDQPGLHLPEPLDEKAQEPRRNVSVHQVRALIGATGNRPSYSPRRVIVIDAIDDLERSAANALLKLLEEPPAGTIFLLVSHAPGRLLPTIRSRCRLLRFDLLPDGDVATILRENLPQTSAADVEALVRAGAGSPGRALRFAGLDLAAIEREMILLAESGDRDNAVRSRLARQLGAKAALLRYHAFLDRAPSFAAERTRTRSGDALRTALDVQAAARELASAATGLSLDAAGTVFEMAGILARLAPAKG